MSDDEQSSSWLDKLSQTFSSEPHNRNDLVQILQQAIKRKIIDEDAFAMIEGVLNVADRQVRDIMIPRTKMSMVHHDHDEGIESLLEKVVGASHSRFPVVGAHKDDVIGILIAKDLLKYFTYPKQPFNILELLRPAYFVPESKRLDTLLTEFRQSHNHMAIVVDEYGGTSGVVTIEDVLEEIVGDIEDEFDAEEKEMIIKLSDQHYRVDAMVAVEDFNDYFHTKLDEDSFDTMGGIITAHFGYVPKPNETLIIDNISFTITAADDRRVIMLELQLPNDSNCD